MLTQSDVKALLDYDPETGVFVWRERGPKSWHINRWNSRYAGTVAGKRSSSGHTLITISKRSYCAHRLAWVWVHGDWPPHQVDHINGKRDDNRLANLRLATHKQNLRNQTTRRSSQSGFKGVTFHKGAGRWMARITVDGKMRYLGLFETAADAATAYRQAAVSMFGEFASWRPAMTSSN